MYTKGQNVRDYFKILHTPGRQITNFSLFWADTAHSGWVENLTVQLQLKGYDSTCP